MKLEKANSRDKKKNKRKTGMQLDNRSIFIIQNVINNKAKKIRKQKENKE